MNLLIIGFYGCILTAIAIIGCYYTLDRESIS